MNYRLHSTHLVTNVRRLPLPLLGKFSKREIGAQSYFLQFFFSLSRKQDLTIQAIVSVEGNFWKKRKK